MKKRLMLCVFVLTAFAAALPAQEVETYRFKALLSPSHETPALTDVNMIATAVVEVIATESSSGDIQSAIVDFRIDYNLGEPETLVNMHIHKGDEGVPGPVVIPTVFGSPVDAQPGPGVLFRVGPVTSASGLATVKDLLANPSEYYVNIHSSSHPAGIIRGQLQPEDPSLQLINQLMLMLHKFAVINGFNSGF